MFEPLFGSRIIEKVLFYMTVNQKCFASELRQSFAIPIFGIQRALMRLEQQGILVSVVEGNNRMYYWNPRHPFLKIFQAFIQQAYISFYNDINLQQLAKYPKEKIHRITVDATSEDLKIAL